jgi:hypothetical protein
MRMKVRGTDRKGSKQQNGSYDQPCQQESDGAVSQHSFPAACASVGLCPYDVRENESMV